ncbi:hypothetical protein AVO45_07190 [Ruegeria marisrubri]|uniref:Uncharacterized protein n=1 Tax=Ruegeria marisrubri TaxID=1685379 RepID=A0A0X3TYS1_9RHOB|nr:hypothetical protein [Ruegeria marisrubri]KUJ80809.1 hypothetical protein AVO45_07190 [Ruegeria marisrubri]
MVRSNDPNDPKGLIREAYRIEGIGMPECRSIFLDWALSLPAGQDQAEALRALHATYAPDAPEHPMTEVLNAGLEAAKAPRRRGGWRSRPRD